MSFFAAHPLSYYSARKAAREARTQRKIDQLLADVKGGQFKMELAVLIGRSRRARSNTARLAKITRQALRMGHEEVSDAGQMLLVLSQMGHHQFDPKWNTFWDHAAAAVARRIPPSVRKAGTRLFSSLNSSPTAEEVGPLAGWAGAVHRISKRLELLGRRSCLRPTGAD